jgi:hypothetical protein
MKSREPLPSFTISSIESARQRLDMRAFWPEVNYNAPNVGFTPGANGQNVNANFGRVLGSLEARRVQLGLRLAF